MPASCSTTSTRQRSQPTCSGPSSPTAGRSARRSSACMCTAASTPAVCDELVKFAATVKIGRGTRRRVSTSGRSRTGRSTTWSARWSTEAINAGAKVLYQSAVPPGPGLFLPITILTDVTPAMRVVKEEVFGPVLTITPFDDEDEALRSANDSEYGLGGSVWSSDPQRAAQAGGPARLRRRLGQPASGDGARHSVRRRQGFGHRRRARPARTGGIHVDPGAEREACVT